jgi:hypothetical protein
MSSTSPKPFKISIPQDKVDRLRQKLSLADFPDELENSGWDYGVPLSDMKRLVKAWQDWNWIEAEKELNQLPMYTWVCSLKGMGRWMFISFIRRVRSRAQCRSSLCMVVCLDDTEIYRFTRK